jgi:hypothetical protein
MTTYRVTASRWDKGWELDIDGVGVTQAHRLTDAEAMARSYISIDLGVPEDSFDVEVIPDLGGAEREALAVRDEIAKLTAALDAASHRSRTVVRTLTREVGLTGADTATLLGISPQRVSQLGRE